MRNIFNRRTKISFVKTVALIEIVLILQQATQAVSSMLVV